jgi:hypothetical protein
MDTGAVEKAGASRGGETTEEGRRDQRRPSLASSRGAVRRGRDLGELATRGRRQCGGDVGGGRCQAIGNEQGDIHGRSWGRPCIGQREVRHGKGAKG